VAEQLGTVGCLSRLVRLRIGQWRLEDAQPLSWINDATSQAIQLQIQSISSQPVSIS
jgi:hypothetical protein